MKAKRKRYCLLFILHLLNHQYLPIPFSVLYILRDEIYSATTGELSVPMPAMLAFSTSPGFT